MTALVSRNRVEMRRLLRDIVLRDCRYYLRPLRVRLAGYRRNTWRRR